MKKTTILTGSLLAVVGVALFAPSARAAQVAYTAGDLLLGFEDPLVPANDYIVDIGPITRYVGVTGTINVTTAFSLGNIAADLTNTFGSSWATNSTTPGNNLQWGIVGATTSLFGADGFPKQTLFLTQAENPVGTTSIAPTENSGSTQGQIGTKINSFGATVNGANPTTNSTVATIQSASAANSWSINNPSLNAFTAGYGVEQATSGSNVGPTNSVLDLYTLVPTTGGGTGSGILDGKFQLDGSGNLSFTGAAAVPEPGSWGFLSLGAGFLGVLRRRRSAVTA